MKNTNDRKTTLVLLCMLVIPVIWAALCVAPFVSGGLTDIITGFASAMNNPLQIAWCEDSIKCILVFLLMYGLGTGVYYATRRNYRKREEHGSAKWGSAGQLARKYADRGRMRSIILTRNVRIGLCEQALGQRDDRHQYLWAIKGTQRFILNQLADFRARAADA